MSELSSGTALRNLQQAQANMKKVRSLLRAVRENPDRAPMALKAGWDSLTNCQKVLAAIPLSAADEAVMTRQIAVQRYATALLVRLRRIARQDFSAVDDEDLGDDDF